MFLGARLDVSIVGLDMSGSTLKYFEPPRAGWFSFFRYFRILLADFDNGADFPLQIGLNREIDVSLIVKRYSLNVLELPAKGCDSFQLFVGCVDVELVVVAVGDIKGTLRVEDCLRRKGVFAVDDAMQFLFAVEQIEYVVFVVSDVEIAAIVKDHALRLGNTKFFPQKLRDLAIASDEEHFVLLAIVNITHTIMS